MSKTKIQEQEQWIREQFKDHVIEEDNGWFIWRKPGTQINMIRYHVY